jgi:ABC-2 type transport system ATP-binding protein
VPVLDSVELELGEGVIVGLLGPNGAGKTTLLKCLLGLLKPTGGAIELLGEDAWTLSAEAKAQLGFVPQKAEFPPWMQVFELVEYLSTFYETWDEAATEARLDRWGIDREAGLATLSGGQTQKLAIILAIAPNPRLLLLDEPAGELDPLGRHELIALLREFVADGRRSVLFSTHIVSDVERVAERVVILHDAKFRYDGAVAELLASGRKELTNPQAALEDIYLHVTRT